MGFGRDLQGSSCIVMSFGVYLCLLFFVNNGEISKTATKHSSFLLYYSSEDVSYYWIRIFNCAVCKQIIPERV
jgi:hypothetical protein